MYIILKKDDFLKIKLDEENIKPFNYYIIVGIIGDNYCCIFDKYVKINDLKSIIDKKVKTYRFSIDIFIEEKEIIFSLHKKHFVLQCSDLWEIKSEIPNFFSWIKKISPTRLHLLSSAVRSYHGLFLIKFYSVYRNIIRPPENINETQMRELFSDILALFPSSSCFETSLGLVARQSSKNAFVLDNRIEFDSSNFFSVFWEMRHDFMIEVLVKTGEIVLSRLDSLKELICKCEKGGMTRELRIP